MRVFPYKNYRQDEIKTLRMSRPLTEQNLKMPLKILTPDHTWMRLNQDEYFQLFFRQYLEILKAHLKQIQVINQHGQIHHSYYTCGQGHDRRNPGWKPFQILERHCLKSRFDFLEARDMIEEQIMTRLKCECEILK